MSDFDLDEILQSLGVDPEEWETDGFGPFDSNMVHVPCGTMIEPDAAQCPQCKVPNPMRTHGLI